MCESTSKNITTDNYKYKDLLVVEQNYLIGVCKRNGSWQIVLTDLVQSYEETLTIEDAVKRCENMNPFLVDIDYQEILNDLFTDIPKYTVKCSEQCIRLEYEIEGGKFRFDIKLKKFDNPELFHKSIIENFYLSFSELHHRYTNLVKIVKKKDDEIEEYKAQGAELLRKSMITEPFSEEIFESKLKNKEPFDKIKVFLNALNLCESIRINIQSNDDSENKSAESEFKSKLMTDSPEKSVKRPSSSKVRCAVGTKFSKKVKTSKQGSAFQYL